MCSPRRHYIVCLLHGPKPYLVPIWSLADPFLVPFSSPSDPYQFPTWSVWSVHGPHVSLIGPYVVPTCSAYSLHGLYLVLTCLVLTWSLHGSLSGLFLGPTWTLPGLTGTNMIPMLSSCCPYVIPTYSACSVHGPYPVMGRLVPTWSLSVYYLVCTWSLYGPIWSLCSPDFVCMVTIWSLRGPYTACLVPAWSLPSPGPYLVDS
jgi:hypothetical protein